jgi:transcriptional regulator GlxA family with amidase domain
MIFKVAPNDGRAGLGDLSSDSEVLPEELIAAAHAVCFAMAFAFRLQGVRNSSTELTIAVAHADPLIRQFERWARGRLTEGFSLNLAAQALATSKRTLARRTQSVLGKSPLAFVQDLRIERALHLLRTSRASVDQIAAEVGYVSGVTLRALLRRRVGRCAREIRRSM